MKRNILAIILLIFLVYLASISPQPHTAQAQSECNIPPEIASSLQSTLHWAAWGMATPELDASYKAVIGFYTSDQVTGAGLNIGAVIGSAQYMVKQISPEAWAKCRHLIEVRCPKGHLQGYCKDYNE